MIELTKLDCDVLVGHNISGFDLDVLLHRAQVFFIVTCYNGSDIQPIAHYSYWVCEIWTSFFYIIVSVNTRGVQENNIILLTVIFIQWLFQTCKVSSSMWSKIGRLRRSVMPRLTKGNTLYGSGASPGIMSCIAGRLLCDTYLCSRDLLKEVTSSAIVLYIVEGKLSIQFFGYSFSYQIQQFNLFLLCRWVIHWHNLQKHNWKRTEERFLHMIYLQCSSLWENFWNW